jgi:hypothetical protein
MATSNSPLAPNPETNIDNPNILPDEPDEQGDLVPFGEPEDEKDPSGIENPEDEDEEEEEIEEEEVDEELPLG